MRWGRKWGNYWGKDIVSPLVVTDQESFPPEALLEWADQDSSRSNEIYHIFVDGKFYDTTTATEILIQLTETGRHWYEVFLSGPGNADEDLSAFISDIPGCRAKLTWTASPAADIYRYKIYWDSGAGGGLTYLAETDSTETEWISSVLDDGTYIFRVDPVDRAGNQTTSSSTVSVTIARYPNPPSDLALESYNYSTQIASFSFVESDTAGVSGYKVYHNNGNGDIDYDTVVLYVAAGNTTFDLSLTTAGEWKVGLRAYNAAWTEDNIDVLSEFELGGSPMDHLEPKPNTPIALIVTPKSGGTFLVNCVYPAHNEESKATIVNIYCDDGAGGAIDYNTVIATDAVDEHIKGEDAVLEIEATSIALTDGKTYTFAAKAATASGTKSDASETATGTADATAPDDISNLAGEDVNYA